MSLCSLPRSIRIMGLHGSLMYQFPPLFMLPSHSYQSFPWPPFFFLTLVAILSLHHFILIIFVSIQKGFSSHRTLVFLTFVVIISFWSYHFSPYSLKVSSASLYERILGNSLIDPWSA